MQRTVGKFTLGVVLVALGLALGFEVYGGAPVLRQVLLRWWPLAIVLLGIEYIVVSRDPEVNARISGGAVFLMILVIASAWIYEAGSNWSDYIHFGDFGNFGITATQPYTYDIQIDEAFGTGVTGLDVRAIGDVLVDGAETQSVTGTATVTVRARTVEEAKQYADEIKLVPRYSGKTLYLEFVRPSSVPGRVSISPSFVLTVPEGSDLDIKTVSGAIAIKNVTGRLELNNVSGSVRLDGRPSRVDVNLVSGSFEGSLGPEMEDLSINTVSGSVTIDVPEGTGGHVSAKTVSGAIIDSAGKLSITNSPGRHEATGSVGTGSTDIDVDTVSGQVSFK